jgi:hypothetical protein
VRQRWKLLLLAGVAAVAALWLRSYLSPTAVVSRKLRAAVAAFEEERLLAVMAAVSRGYSDPWGVDYETLGGHLDRLMRDYDGLDVELALGEALVAGEEVRIGLEFAVSGRGEEGWDEVLGSATEPCAAVLVWRKETPGWRLASTLELDIPELRDELEAARSSAKF